MNLIHQYTAIVSNSVKFAFLNLDVNITWQLLIFLQLVMRLLTKNLK